MRALENEGGGVAMSEFDSAGGSSITADRLQSHQNGDQNTPQLKLEPMNLTFTP